MIMSDAFDQLSLFEIIDIVNQSQKLNFFYGINLYPTLLGTRLSNSKCLICFEYF